MLDKSNFRFAVVGQGSTYGLLAGSNSQLHRDAIQLEKLAC